MTVWILCHVVLGACFGLATHSHRHLFSEGASRPCKPGEEGLLDTRLAWALLCSVLWPLMALTGLFSFWRLARVKVRPSPNGRR